MTIRNKTINLLIVVFLSASMLIACSSSKSMKKKCLDCPKFSYAEPFHDSFTEMNEE